MAVVWKYVAVICADVPSPVYSPYADVRCAITHAAVVPAPAVVFAAWAQCAYGLALEGVMLLPSTVVVLCQRQAPLL